MADHTHIHPAGTTFWYSTDGINYTQVFDLAEIEGPEGTMGKSDDTTLSTANKQKVSTPGWSEFGDVPMMTYFYKALVNTLYGYFTGRTTLYWRAVLPVIDAESNGSKWEYTAYISKFKTHGKAAKGSDDKIMVEIGLTPCLPNAQPLLTQGS
jgi:hypothetical protein